MKKALILITFVFCSFAYAQEPMNNDLIIDATEARDFKIQLESLSRENPDKLTSILFKVATGNEIPSGTATVSVNQAQLDRWFSTTKNTSAISQIYNGRANVAISNGWKPGQLPSHMITVLEAQATERISNQAKRERYLSKLEALKASATQEDY